MATPILDERCLVISSCENEAGYQPGPVTPSTTDWAPLDQPTTPTSDKAVKGERLTRWGGPCIHQELVCARALWSRSLPWSFDRQSLGHTSHLWQPWRLLDARNRRNQNLVNGQSGEKSNCQLNHPHPVCFEVSCPLQPLPEAQI